MITNMDFLQSELAKRELPPILTASNGTAVIPGTWRARRKELIDILSKNLYGYTPNPPECVAGEIIEENRNAVAGKALYQKIMIKFDTPSGEFKFPIMLYIPKNTENPSIFIHIALHPVIPGKYTPIEEIIDNGFAIALFCYQDVTKDLLNGDYTDGLAGMYIGNRERKPDEWGRIGMWAFAASRVLDYLRTRTDINKHRAAVVGHSRLGKTALWAAAQDERFYMAAANGSGFGGAAVSKFGTGRRVGDYIRVGIWDWFCENFKQFYGREDDNTVFDQHMLLAATAPRKICLGNAALDDGSDPKSEFLACAAASEAYELLGYDGLVTDYTDDITAYPEAPTVIHEGNIGYHIREGTHYFSRFDWQLYMKFLNK